MVDRKGRVATGEPLPVKQVEIDPQSAMLSRALAAELIALLRKIVPGIENNLAVLLVNNRYSAVILYESPRLRVQPTLYHFAHSGGSIVILDRDAGYLKKRFSNLKTSEFVDLGNILDMK